MYNNNYFNFYKVFLLGKEYPFIPIRLFFNFRKLTTLNCIFKKKNIINESRGQLWRRQWQPTPVLLPGKSHGRRSLVGCSPWGRTESDTTETT